MAECKIGVVGVGKMGEYHVGVLSDIYEAELVGVNGEAFDKLEEKLVKAEQKLLEI